MKKDMPKEFRGGFSAISIVVLIVILAILAGGGYFVYQYQKIRNLPKAGKEISPTPLPPVSSVTPPSAQIKPQTEEINTSNWKTYRNEQYGFEFKYPEDYEPRDFLEKNKSLPWLQSTVLFIGVCRIEIGYDCDGGLMRVVKGEFKQAWKFSKVFHRNDFIVEVNLPEEILSTFKFVPSTSSRQVK